MKREKRPAAAPALFILLTVGYTMTVHANELPDFRQLWDFDDPADTERRFREILPQAEASSDRGYHAELLTQIARTLGLQRKFDDASALLSKAEAMAGPEPSRARVRVLLERGRVANSSGHPEESQPFFEEAHRVAAAVNEDGLAMDALHMLGIVEKGDAAIERSLQAIALAEKSEDPKVRSWLGPLYNNTGWSYHDAERYPEALALFEKGLAVREANGDVGPIRIARYTLGRVKRSMGELEEALVIQTTIRDEIVAAGDAEDGYVHEEIGECLAALERDPVAAQEAFAKAHALLSQDTWLKENEADRLARLATLGQIEGATP